MFVFKSTYREMKASLESSISDLEAQIARMRPRPLEWEQPCKANNYCLLARTGYGTYYIHMDGGRRHAWLDAESNLEEWIGEESGSTSTEQQKCQDQHVRRVTAELRGEL